jgi:(4S)-4-hydroxy-5-phosphonooxypentane-2,3-dione isomerase
MMSFLARMKVHGGKEQDFIRLVKLLTKEVHAHEPGCLYYEFYKLREPLAYAVFESFVDAAAEEKHRDTPHFHKLAPDLIACLDGPYVREYLDSID